jgi:uncharacterized protein YcbK (DUF882 family)
MFDWSKYAVGGAKRPDSFTGLNPDFSTALSQMLLAAEADLGPNALSITSAYRSPEKQAELYEAALKKYGSPAAARKWVAPPGRSMHNKGLAVDFGAAGGGLLRDPNSREAQWLKANATKFGLDVPMSWEPWQVELAGAREGKKIAAETMSLLGKGPQTSTKGPQMMQEQKPQGLLGSLGIQKMEEGAEGETGQRFYNRDSFKDTAAVLAQGFGRMGIMGMEEIADSVAKQRTEVKAKNKTMEALMKMGTPQAQAAVEYINAGGDPVSALKMAFERPKAQAGVAVGDRLVNPVTGEVIYEDAQQAGTLSKDQLSGLNSLRDDLRTELKPFEIVKSGYNNITTFYNNPSATSDYALAVAFAKILDPGSVAREGEVAAVQNAGARIPALGQALKNAVTGEGQLTQEVRQQIAELATKVYTERQGEAQQTIAGYGEIAKRAGLPAEFLYSGSIPEAAAVVPAVVPPNAASQGVTQAEWDDATPEEKKAWLE